jgi:hypothetical protein
MNAKSRFSFPGSPRDGWELNTYPQACEEFFLPGRELADDLVSTVANRHRRKAGPVELE